MQRIKINAALRAELRDLSRPLEICDEDGNVLGHFEPASGKPRKVTSPFSDAEIAEFAKLRVGRPLADILRDLGTA